MSRLIRSFTDLRARNNAGEDVDFGAFADKVERETRGREVPGLVGLRSKYFEKGLRVLFFPCNQAQSSSSLPTTHHLGSARFSGKQKGKQRVPSTLRFRKFPGKTEGIWCSDLETREFPCL